MTMRLVYKKNLKTSAVSSTNFGSILVFASCVVGTCNILRMWVSFFLMGGVLNTYVDYIVFLHFKWLVLVFYENILRTSAVSSTNFGLEYSSLQAALLVL